VSSIINSPPSTPNPLSLPSNSTFVRKSEAARHATGPTSPQGKAISAQNARKHGFAGATMVIDDEDRPAYNAHLEGYIQAFQPQNQPQHDAVRLAANAMWRIDRLTTIESHLLDFEVAWNRPFTEANLAGLQDTHHLTIAFLQHTQSSNALDLCRRYLSSAQRDYQRAISAFEKLKEITCPVAAPESENVPQSEPQPQNHQKIEQDPNELAESTETRKAATPHTRINRAHPPRRHPQRAA
jgi:hypothetical protein